MKISVGKEDRVKGTTALQALFTYLPQGMWCQLPTQRNDATAITNSICQVLHIDFPLYAASSILAGVCRFRGNFLLVSMSGLEHITTQDMDKTGYHLTTKQIEGKNTTLFYVERQKKNLIYLQHHLTQSSNYQGICITN